MAPWRDKDCGGPGCSFMDLKIADYWALTVLFCNQLGYPFKNLARDFGSASSDEFAKEFADVAYRKMTGSNRPDFIMSDIF